MLGQAGTISNDDAMALYKYLVDSGDWSQNLSATAVALPRSSLNTLYNPDWGLVSSRWL